LRKFDTGGYQYRKTVLVAAATESAVTL